MADIKKNGLKNEVKGKAKEVAGKAEWLREASNVANALPLF